MQKQLQAYFPYLPEDLPIKGIQEANTEIHQMLDGFKPFVDIWEHPRIAEIKDKRQEILDKVFAAA